MSPLGLGLGSPNVSSSLRFSPRGLNPYLLFDARESMGSSGFLDSVSTLSNLASGSNQGGDATQTTALNQPKALPLIDGKGYLYLPRVSGNGAQITSDPATNTTGDIDIRAKLSLPEANWIPPVNSVVVARDQVAGSARIYTFFIRHTTGALEFSYYNASGVLVGVPNSGVSPQFSAGETGWVRVTREASSGDLKYWRSNNGTSWTQVGSTKSTPAGGLRDSSSHLTMGFRGDGNLLRGRLHEVQIYSSINNTSKVLDIDFNATNIRHGDTEFACATGQTVTINQSGNDPATIIKKPVLRFDGVRSQLHGLFANNINGGYMFAAFSVLGDGGENWGRIFSVHNSASAVDANNSGFIFSLRDSGTNDLGSFYYATFNLKNDLFDDDNGDILHEVRSKSGQHLVSVNGDSIVTDSKNTPLVDSNVFNISASADGQSQVAIDLEYLALFPSSITDAQADSVRNYINNRNSVFDLKDGYGYYYFDPSSLSAGPVTSWNGQLIGSDNDANLTITQTTSSDQPTSAGMAVTFNDNSDHLDVPSGFVEPADGSWQVVGTSLGTFSYKVNANAVSELNLLGNRGGTAYRQSGDLYGIILLPSSATAQDIQGSRKLLIDKGATDGATGDVTSAWRNRADIVQFDGNLSDVTSAYWGWTSCSSLTSFSSDLPSATNVSGAWYNCFALTSFSSDLASATNAENTWRGCSSFTSFSSDLPLVTNVVRAWFGCSSLTSFSSDLPSVTNATSAWQNCSSLISFSSALPSATTVSAAWHSCTSLTSFSSDLPSVTNAGSSWRDCSSLTSFSSDLPLASNASYAWNSCSSLTSFSSDLPALTTAYSTWNSCSSLTSFSSDLSSASNVGFAWQNCSSLTSFSSDLASVTYAESSWRDCNSLTSFSSDLPLVTNVFLAWLGCSSLTSFSSDLSSASNASYAWHSCYSLTSFTSDLPLASNVRNAWYNCTSLTDFSVGVFTNWNPSSISSGVFNLAWDGCTSLTSQSVENILTSIDSSGKHATSTGASGGSALADAGIDIDYDGTTLSSSTYIAVNSLKSKGWSIIVNNVTL